MKAMHGTAPKRAARMQRCRPRPHARDQRPSEFRGLTYSSLSSLGSLFPSRLKTRQKRPRPRRRCPEGSGRHSAGRCRSARPRRSARASLVAARMAAPRPSLLRFASLLGRPTAHSGSRACCRRRLGQKAQRHSLAESRRSLSWPLKSSQAPSAMASLFEQSARSSRSAWKHEACSSAESAWQRNSPGGSKCRPDGLATGPLKDPGRGGAVWDVAHAACVSVPCLVKATEGVVLAGLG